VKTNTKGHTRNHWNASSKAVTLSVEATNIVVRTMHFYSYMHDRAQDLGWNQRSWHRTRSADPWIEQHIHVRGGLDDSRKT